MIPFFLSWRRLPSPQKTPRFPSLVLSYVMDCDQTLQYKPSFFQFYSRHKSIPVYDALFQKLWKWYKYRERYHIYRCFSQASRLVSETLHSLVLDLYKPAFARLQAKTKLSYGTQYVDDITRSWSGLQGVWKKKERWYLRLARLFGLVSSFVLFLDIFVSVGFVMSVTYMLHDMKEVVQSYWGLFWLILAASFVKIVLDKFVVTPLVFRRGWQRYAQSINAIKDELARFEALGLILRYDLDYEKDIIQVMKRFEQYRRVLFDSKNVA
ncbi:MAG: hypothetical protein NZL83_03815 [Candidatus Absconditabacterales bacterium]|nr:hypothetical protein [Candidatus Absconditabacterales bacterium]